MTVTLEREHDHRVARVTYDNSAKGNSFTDDTLRELAGTLEDAADDPRCVVVRLDMIGDHFCGGWDTSSFGGLSASTADEVAAALRASDSALARIRQLPVPVVAAVRGKIIGFGVGLLGALHLPVAANGAHMSLPEVRYGFAPAGVGYFVARSLPRAQAYGLLTGVTTGTSAQMLSWGLVSRVVPDDQLDAVVDALVEQLALTPGAVLRAVVDVVESSIETGAADRAFLASALTIVTSSHAVQ